MTAHRPVRIPRQRRFLLAAAALVALAGAPRPGLAETTPGLSTEAYLELPELFQVSVVSGSMAILTRWADDIGDADACHCYARWTAPEDVVALVSLHARRTPGAYRAEFADTLIAALREQCASGG